ncbi:GAF domain-containing protein [bacterium]|nr:GAF domain-containing protein [bacterium]
MTGECKPMRLEDYYKHLNAIATAAQKSLHLEDILNMTLDEVIPIINGHAAEILVYEPDSGLLLIKSHRGLSPAMVDVGVLEMGEGLAGKIAQKKEPLFIHVLDSSSGIPLKIIQKENLASYAGIPLVCRNKLVGVLGLYTRVVRSFTSEEQQLLSEIGEIVGQAVYNGLQYEETALRARRFIAVSRAISVTQKIDNLNSVLENLAKVVVQSMGFDGAWIGILNKDKNRIEGRAGFGLGLKAKAGSIRYELEEGSNHPVTQTLIVGNPMVFQFRDDVSNGTYRKWLEHMKIQSAGLVPISGGNESLGVMAAFYCNDQSFDEGGTKALASVAGQTAIAIENSRLYEQMKQSEARYRTLFESTGPSLVIIDQKQTFQLVNCAFETLCGYKRKDLIGKRSLDRFIKPNGKNPDLAESGHFETEFTDRHGQVRQIHITSTPIPNSDHMLVSIVDMTPQRELERRLYRSEELASIGELSAGIAHEIRNPLVAIKTSVGLLQEEPELSEDGHQLLEVVKEETDQMAAIIEDFLQFARPKPPTFEEVEINQVIRDVVKRYRELNGHIHWKEHLSHVIPPLWLDRYQIQQVMTNLILNAVDAMASGGTLKVRSDRETGPDSQFRIRITIADTGQGIPPENINKIFQPFFSTKEKGTGMGLAICRRIVDQHGGDIEVKSQEDKGTQFSVILPAEKQTS